MELTSLPVHICLSIVHLEMGETLSIRCPFFWAGRDSTKVDIHFVLFNNEISLDIHTRNVDNQKQNKYDTNSA